MNAPTVLEPRCFRHVDGFVDGTAYLRCDPDGRTVLIMKDGTRRRSPYTVNESIRFVRDGIWEEFTPEAR